MIDPPDVSSELATEGDETDKIVPGLDERQWQMGTPGGWEITHQSSRRARRGRSADLRSTSVCW